MPDNAPREYSPDRFELVFNGLLVFGFSDQLVTIENDEDGFQEEAGAGGDVVLVKNLNEIGKVTISLQGVSPCNDLLMAMYTSMRETGVGKGPLLAKYDRRIVAQATWAWIKKPPAQGYAKDHGNREWVIGCAKLRNIVLGSVR